MPAVLSKKKEENKKERVDNLPLYLAFFVCLFDSVRKKPVRRKRSWHRPRGKSYSQTRDDSSSTASTLRNY